MKNDKAIAFGSYVFFGATAFWALGVWFGAFPALRWGVFSLLVLAIALIAGGSIPSWLAMVAGKGEEFNRLHGVISLVPVVGTVLFVLVLFVHGVWVGAGS